MLCRFNLVILLSLISFTAASLKRTKRACEEDCPEEPQQKIPRTLDEFVFPFYGLPAELLSLVAAAVYLQNFKDVTSLPLVSKYFAANTNIKRVLEIPSPFFLRYVQLLAQNWNRLKGPLSPFTLRWDTEMEQNNFFTNFLNEASIQESPLKKHLNTIWSFLYDKQEDGCLRHAHIFEASHLSDGAKKMLVEEGLMRNGKLDFLENDVNIVGQVLLNLEPKVPLVSLTDHYLRVLLRYLASAGQMSKLRTVFMNFVEAGKVSQLAQAVYALWFEKLHVQELLAAASGVLPESEYAVWKKDCALLQMPILKMMVNVHLEDQPLSVNLCNFWMNRRGADYFFIVKSVYPVGHPILQNMDTLALRLSSPCFQEVVLNEGIAREFGLKAISAQRVLNAPNAKELFFADVAAGAVPYERVALLVTRLADLVSIVDYIPKDATTLLAVDQFLPKSDPNQLHDQTIATLLQQFGETMRLVNFCYLQLSKGPLAVAPEYLPTLHNLIDFMVRTFNFPADLVTQLKEACAQKDLVQRKQTMIQSLLTLDTSSTVFMFLGDAIAYDRDATGPNNTPDILMIAVFKQLLEFGLKAKMSLASWFSQRYNSLSQGRITYHLLMDVSIENPFAKEVLDFADALQLCFESFRIFHPQPFLGMTVKDAIKCKFLPIIYINLLASGNQRAMFLFTFRYGNPQSIFTPNRIWDVVDSEPLTTFPWALNREKAREMYRKLAELFPIADIKDEQERKETEESEESNNSEQSSGDFDD